MSNEDAGSPPTAEPRYELDPRTGAFVLASVMEERRARNRTRNTPTQARLRAAQKAEEARDIEETLRSLPPCPSVRLSAQSMEDDQAALREWLALDLPRQRQLRKNADRIFTCRIALQRERLQQDDPEFELTPATLARVMAKLLKRNVDRHEARKTLNQVLALEKPGGPWGTVR